MAKNEIVIKGAKENNLKKVDLVIPRDKFVVFTGLSGSGKTSLAFDTIYAEGQRRYVESLSSYARMFLGQAEKPDVEYIEGLSPAISIDQKTTARNPRSTVGTVTEIYDYLRLMYARIGLPHCPKCGKPITQQTVDQICDKITELGDSTRIIVMAPVIRAKKGEHKKVFEDARKSGYVRVRADGIIYELEEDIPLEKNKKHSIDIVIDRIIVREDSRGRIAEAVEAAMHLSGGLVTVQIHGEDGSDMHFSSNYACDDCGISIDELSPRMFSFNSPFGACNACDGLGFTMEVDPELVIPDMTKSLAGGAVRASGWYGVDYTDSMVYMQFTALAKHYGFSLDTPLCDLPKDILDIILYGNGGEKIEMHYTKSYGSGVYKSDYEGVITNLQRRYNETQSDWVKNDIGTLMRTKPCSACGGKRLKKEVLAVTVGDINIHEFTEMPVLKSLEFIENLKLSTRDESIAKQIIKEIKARLKFLINVGLDYLTLSRAAATLSGGEAQRIRLATQIGSGLTGVLYILDEPSIGLHQRDNSKLIGALKGLRDLGNTLIVVEHDEETMLEADHIVDVGPGAGIHGGQIVASGTAEEIMKCENSVTGQYLSGKKKIEIPKSRRPGNGNLVTVKGAAENNLKNVDASFPLGALSVVTGVSGSGKSSLLMRFYINLLPRKLTVLRPSRASINKSTELNILTRLLILTSHQSEEHHVQTLQHIQVCLRIYASFLLQPTMQRCVATNQTVSALMSAADGVKPAQVTVLLK